MAISIRPIEEYDFEDLIFLFKEFAVFEKVPERMVNTLEQMKQEKEFILGFVARDDNNNIAGYVTCFFSYYTWVGKSLYMDDLYVKQEYRGKGIGTLLINKIIDFAKREKCNKVRWQVSSWNQPAISFYESLGAKIDNIEMNCDLIINTTN